MKVTQKRKSRIASLALSLMGGTAALFMQAPAQAEVQGPRHSTGVGGGQHRHVRAWIAGQEVVDVVTGGVDARRVARPRDR